jgi:hypothetical protein
MPNAEQESTQRLCDSISKSLTLKQLRERRWQLTKEFVCRAAVEQPTWQLTVDVALNRTVLAQARVLALGELVHYYPDQCALILLRVITTRGDHIGVRMAAAHMLATSESRTAEYALLRAIEDNATDQALTLVVDEIAKNNAAGVPNNLRWMMCKEAQGSEPGRRALRRIWRAPDQYPNAWIAVASILLGDNDDSLFVEAANMAATPAYGKRARVMVLQMLFTQRRLNSGQVLYPPAYWSAIRQIWSRDSGDLRYAAGEILKLQGAK